MTADQSTSPDSLALILAGGGGARLGELTAWRSKCAVPFGGHCRAIDFALSNCIHSGVRQIVLLTQYKSQSLIRHVQNGWGFLHRELGEFIDIWPAQQRCGERWYSGTVDAVRQNLDLIATDYEHVLVLSGDHVYAMDYSDLLEEHAANRADLTVGCVEIPHEQAGGASLVVSDGDRRVRGLSKQPLESVTSSGRRNTTLVPMSVFAFTRAFLFHCLTEEVDDCAFASDFTCDILPGAIGGARVFAHPFRDLFEDRPGYWRDIGTVDSYWQAHMDLLDDPPKLMLFDDRWPIWTHQVSAGPATIQGCVRLDAAILGRGCTVAGEVSHSVLSTSCRIGKHSRITNSVLLPNVRVGEGCSLDHVIVDSNCAVPDGTVIDSNSPASAERFVSPQGAVLITRANAAAQGRFPASRKVA
jgi:glucose-1-phosphate adenylyltransferase